MITSPIKTVNKYKFDHFNTDQVRAIIKNRMMIVTLATGGTDLKIPLDKIAGRVTSFREKDGEFFCEWISYETKNGKEAKKLSKKGYIRPVGIGSITDGVVQDDYKILYVVIEK